MGSPVTRSLLNRSGRPPESQRRGHRIGLRAGRGARRRSGAARLLDGFLLELAQEAGCGGDGLQAGERQREPPPTHHGRDEQSNDVYRLSVKRLSQPTGLMPGSRRFIYSSACRATGLDRRPTCGPDSAAGRRGDCPLTCTRVDDVWCLVAAASPRNQTTSIAYPSAPLKSHLPVLRLVQTHHRQVAATTRVVACDHLNWRRSAWPGVGTAARAARQWPRRGAERGLGTT